MALRNGQRIILCIQLFAPMENEKGGGGSPQPPSREKSVCMSEREKCVCVSARERENTGRQICRWAEYGCGGG